jgi:hypothetical protein
MFEKKTFQLLIAVSGSGLDLGTAAVVPIC